ncbi:putative minor structural protein II [Bacillus phage P59]|nr:putative minor structural protein II [Bacillus phage P59]
MPIVATGQKTLIDMNDITPSPTPPANPTEGMLWLDTSKDPYRLKIRRGTSWDPEGPSNLNELDPDAYQKVTDAYNGITDLDSQGKLTRYERSVVRGELANIIGKFLGNAEAMPTIATIDASGVGQAYAIRKSARDLGVPTSHTTYTNFGNAYEALRTYLSGLSPKAWDVGSSATNNVTEATWDAKWNEYYLRYNLLNVEIQTRQQQYADSVGDDSVAEAIQAVSNSDQFELEPITDSTIVTSPINSVGLPEFYGRHTDSWYIDGKNLLLGSGDSVTTASYAVKDYYLTETLVEGEQVTFTMKATLGAGKTHFALYNSGGSTSLGTLSPQPDGTYKLTFNWRSNEINEFLRVYHMVSSTVVESTIEWAKLERGSVANPVYSLAPEESVGAFGNRIKPVTTPIFNAVSPVTLLGKFYGDGTNNDSFYWDSNGRAVKDKYWDDVILDGSYNWENHEASISGAKGVKISGFFESVVDVSVQAVKSDGKFLSTITQGLSTADQIIGRNSDSTLYLTIADSDSGWGGSYAPTPEEIKAYFNGWKMCNGTWGTPYSGSGNKVWYPIGDTDLTRSTAIDNGEDITYNPVPTDQSAAISDRRLHFYQIVYRLADPVQEIIEFDGVMTLLKGDNAVTVTYPNGTPKILSGNIKYAINLATVTDTLHYIIPAVMKRVAKAEEVITDDAIVNTVTNSVSYQLEMARKANASDLGEFATNDSVDQKLKNGLDSIDFSPYVTQSELDQTSKDITAKFSATGGMNLIKNSIGFAELEFWQNPYGADHQNPVQTLSTIELDTLGFGSGFLYNPDGVNKGITQEVNVIAGQPYTLSWYMRKGTKSAASDVNYRVFVQIQEKDSNGTWVTVVSLGDNSDMSTVGYLAQNFTFTPEKDLIKVRFIGYGQVDATITGIMLTIGDVPLQWSLATGEVYNTYIRMDINGIRVSQLDEDRKEVGYTEISPDEFAGYYRNSNGGFDKIFYLNGTETVTTRLRAKEEITMGSIKIVRVDSPNNTGWAWISNADDPDA